MDTEKINRWLTLLANIGVVAGIVFLAVEIRQNQAILEESNQYNFLEMRAISLESYNDFRALVVQDAELSAHLVRWSCRRRALRVGRDAFQDSLYQFGMGGCDAI